MDKTKETGNQVYRSYKDRLFRMVFREKKGAAQLERWADNLWETAGKDTDTTLFCVL